MFGWGVNVFVVARPATGNPTNKKKDTTKVTAKNASAVSRVKPLSCTNTLCNEVLFTP